MMHLLRSNSTGMLYRIFKHSPGERQKTFTPKIFFQSILASLLLAFLPGSILAQGFAGGSGTESDPYEITTWEQLNNVRNHLDEHFILKNNLDENSTGYDEYASSNANEGQGWDPIGNYSYNNEDEQAFTGTFDGDGHTISDLFIKRFNESEDEVEKVVDESNGEDLGLFGYVYGEGSLFGDLSELNEGIIQNLALENVDIFGEAFIGTVVGTNEGVLNNVSASGVVRGIVGVGGIAGDNYALIIGSSSSANVLFPLVELMEEYEELIYEGEVAAFGGIVGYNEGIVGLSHATGYVGITNEALENTIDVDEGGTGIDFGFFFGTGGLIGLNEGATVASYATGDVGGLFAAGGLIGANGFSDIPLKNISKQRVRTNEVSFSSALDLSFLESYFEGIDQFEVRNTYATGDVRGFFFSGGLVGTNDSEGLIVNSYSSGSLIFWLIEFEELPEELPEDLEEIYEDLGFGGLTGTASGIGGPPPLTKSIDNFYLKSFDRFADAVNIEAGADELEENVINSFWDIQTSGIEISGGGTGKSTSEMKLIDTFTNPSTEGLSESWDFDDLWAIRSGDYISYPFFGNDNNAPEQNPAPGLMQVAGIRLMAGAGEKTEVPSDLIVFGGDDRITITTLPGRGALLLNDSEVESNAEILKSDIDSGNLTYVAEDESDKTMFGYEYSSFEYQAAENVRTLDIDLAARAINYNLPEGWVLFSSPSEGQNVGGMLDNIRTEGYVGSDKSGASFPTVYTLDQEDYEWDSIDNSNQIFVPGEGLLVYIFDEDTPKEEMLTSNGPWAPLDGTFTYDDLLWYDPDQGSGGNSHFLIGNPHPVGINICRMLAQGSNIANSIDIWVSSKNDGNGGYVNYSCDVRKELPPTTAFDAPEDLNFAVPFLGFWVRTTDENPSLSITENDYIPYDYTTKENVETKPELLTLDLNHDERNYSETVHILHSNKAETGLDRIDAIKLSSAGLVDRYLSFFAMDEENRSYALRSLPTQTEEMVIPLGIETTETGSYSLSWTLPGSPGMDYALRDTKSGSRIELSEGATYRFTISEKEVEVVSENQIINAKMGTAQKAEDISPRFELVINQTSGGGSDELPNNITLDQNYPNPFNPTTVIQYQIPQAAEVNLTVFDMAGREVAELVNGQVSAGSHTINFDASRLSSGVYMYRLRAGSTMLTRKLTVIK